MCFSSIVGLERHIPRCFKNSHIEDRVWEIFKRFFFFSNYRRRGGGGADTRTKVVSARCDAISCECIFLARPYNNARESLIFLSSRLSYVYTTTSSFLGFLLYIPISSPGYFQFSLTLAISSSSFFLFVQFNWIFIFLLLLLLLTFDSISPFFFWNTGGLWDHLSSAFPYV